MAGVTSCCATKVVASSTPAMQSFIVYLVCAFSAHIVVDAKITTQGTLPGNFLLPQASSSLDPRLAALAGQWFLHSGIQEPNGGVARYHHSDTGRNARVSTEITGYTVSALLFLYERYGDPAVLTAAVKAGQFLVDIAWSPSLKTFPFEYAADGDAVQPLTYFFDCGIIVRGLLQLSRVTGKPGYAEIAKLAGESMIHDFATGDTWHPILNLPGKYPLTWTDQWSRRPGCYQLKAALAWHDLHKATGKERFSQAYSATLTKALATEADFLPAETPEKTMDRLHAYSYFLEALLPVVDRADVRIALANGIAKVSGYLREIRPQFERSDVYAQLLRVRLLAAQNAGVPLNLAEAAEEAARLEQFQIENPGSPDHGGFWFARKHGNPTPFTNPVSTAFCLQAYAWWQDYGAGQRIVQAVI
jgi:hypothetical protein